MPVLAHALLCSAPGQACLYGKWMTEIIIGFDRFWIHRCSLTACLWSQADASIN